VNESSAGHLVRVLPSGRVDKDVDVEEDLHAA
jgi:hypothetical protein